MKYILTQVRPLSRIFYKLLNICGFFKIVILLERMVRWVNKIKVFCLIIWEWKSATEIFYTNFLSAKSLKYSTFVLEIYSGKSISYFIKVTLQTYCTIYILSAALKHISNKIHNKSYSIKTFFTIECIFFFYLQYLLL